METKERRETCEQKIDNELKERLKEIRLMVKQEEKGKETLKDENGDQFEGLSDWVNSWALALSKTVVYKLELSYGGPQDYFEFEHDPESRELLEVRYRFLDWFDGAVRTIGPNSEGFKELEELFYATILIE